MKLSSQGVLAGSVFVAFVFLCACMLLDMQDHSKGKKWRYVPRYMFEKEIRGSSYHKVHRIFLDPYYENSGIAKKIKYNPSVWPKYQMRYKRSVKQGKSDFECGDVCVWDR